MKRNDIPKKKTTEQFYGSKICFITCPVCTMFNGRTGEEYNQVDNKLIISYRTT